MLKVAYIATSLQVVKPKKLTSKQLLLQEATDMLAVVKHLDRQKALKKYAPELKSLEDKKMYLKQLENERR